MRGSGPESDIVISSRIRLARNLADYPFVGRASDADRARIEDTLHGCVSALQEESQLLYVDIKTLAELDRQFLVERHLISREHAESHGARAVAIDGHEQYSLMVNEEDHLRIQVMHSGLDLESAPGNRSTGLDDLVEQKVTYAFHETSGLSDGLPDQRRARACASA